MSVKKNVKDYFNQYNIEDAINSKVNYLFILESPHKAEIKNNYPVAGSSGIEMTKFIYSLECNDAFGKLVNYADDYKDKYNGLNQFGIMNISPAPMQKSALGDNELLAREEKIIHILEKLRVNYQARTHRNKEWNLVKEELVNNFSTRLINVLSNYGPKYLIPCGKLAQNYLELALINNKLADESKVISDIPHPSRNQWRHYDTMSKLKFILSQDIYLK